MSVSSSCTHNDSNDNDNKNDSVPSSRRMAAAPSTAAAPGLLRGRKTPAAHSCGSRAGTGEGCTRCTMKRPRVHHLPEENTHNTPRTHGPTPTTPQSAQNSEAEEQTKRERVEAGPQYLFPRRR